jgi:hypothetical protein
VTTLTGSSAEADLSLAQQEALRRAIDELEPHAAHPTVGALVGKMTGALNDEDETELAKAMTDARSALAKSESLSPSAREAVAKSCRALEVEYLAKSSGAYQGWRGTALSEIQKSECGRGWDD